MSDTEKNNILIVDDELDILSLLEDVLTRRGYSVHSADNIKKATSILEKHPGMDLIVSDIKMPEGTGAELLKKLRLADPIKPKFVFLTALADLSIEDICDRGAAGFIEKPIDIKNFANNIEKILRDVGICQSDLCDDIPSNAEMSMSLPSSSFIGIGTGGMFVPTDVKAKPGDIVRFEIDFKNKDNSINGVGEVVWTRKKNGDLPQGIGIKFLYLSAKAHQIVRTAAKNSGTTAFIPRK